jgi:hypothetical protein
MCSGATRISRGTDGLQTRRWRETDSNPRSPVAKGCFRFGEGEAGRVAETKSRSRDGEYLKRDRRFESGALVPGSRAAPAPRKTNFR